MHVIEIAHDHCIVEEDGKHYITDSITNYQCNTVECCGDIVLLAEKKKKELIKKGYEFVEIDEKTLNDILNLKKKYDWKNRSMPIDTIFFKLGKIKVLTQQKKSLSQMIQQKDIKNNHRKNIKLVN